jgi:CHASE2 domain-containing sensor protein/two-component sensor histidine kinase
MLHLNTRRIREELAIWRQAAIPGLTVLIIVIIARLTGLLQGIEWLALDTFLLLRPPEPTDDKVVIISINEADITQVDSYPIPDKNLASLIHKIQTYKPTVIGIDIYRNLPVEPGNKELIQAFQQYNNIIGIAKVLPPGEILPPPQLPPANIGFADIVADRDGKYRRYLLWTPSLQNPDNPNEDKYSLAVQLASKYLLSTQGIKLETGKDDPDTMRFQNTEIPRFLPNSGGYVGENATGLKMLVNFRSGRQPFRFISMNDMQNGKVKPEWLRDKIIIIGMTSASASDFLNTSAIISPISKISGQIYGVEFQAHATSQIINAVLHHRPVLKVWSDEWEYLWIVVWGFIPIIIGRLTQDIWKNLLAVVTVVIFLTAISHLLLLSGWWIPSAPILILAISGSGLSAFAFYKQYEQTQRKIKLIQYTIEHTFTLIHNGPLQTLANILQQTRTQLLPSEQLTLQLEKLNYEIRAIGEYLTNETLNQHESLRLGSGLKINLNRPVNELLYEVYTSTISRQDLNNFHNINVKVRTFEPIDERYLNLEIKQALCLFLEEALCNIGKHAQGVKRVEAIGKQEHNLYTLMIKDNGCGINSLSENKGLKQLKNIAKNLGGNFKIESLSPKGTLCAVTWKLNQK